MCILVLEKVMKIFLTELQRIKGVVYSTMVKRRRNYVDEYGNDLAIKKINIALLPTYYVSSNSPFICR